jgi:predicted small secreted protein
LKLCRRIGLIAIGVAFSVLLAGCPDPNEVAGVGVTGCQREIDGVTAETRTETSKLNCAAINDLVSSLPSKPENFLIRGDSPRLLWKCSYFGTEQGPVLFRCENAKRHFSIVKGAD